MWCNFKLSIGRFELFVNSWGDGSGNRFEHQESVCDFNIDIWWVVGNVAEDREEGFFCWTEAIRWRLGG